MRHRSRKGFTLIELLIVVVIIGILAAIAIPKFGSSKESAYVGVMRGDLRNLVTAQESYYSDNNFYFGGTVPNAGLVYNPSPNVTITIASADSTGWAAVATMGVTPRQCAVFQGTASPVAPATQAGIIACS